MKISIPLPGDVAVLLDEHGKDLIDRLIDLSFAEDIGDGDHTTLSCIPADAMGKSKLLIKEEGIYWS